MGVSRNIRIRLLTNLNFFSDIITVLISEGYCFGEKNKIVTLSENDVDEFNYMEFDTFDIVKGVLDKREQKGYNNYIVIWDNETDESLLVSSTKLENNYSDYKNHYDINFAIGYGVRIKDAERYTDFSIYLNKLLPVLLKNSIYLCEINCSDYNC